MTLRAWRVLLLVLVVAATGGSGLSADSLPLYVFYASDCDHCYRIATEFFPKIFASYSGDLDLRFYEIDLAENYDALVEVEDAWGVTQKEFPIVVVGEQLLDLSDVESRLGEVLAGYVDQEVSFPYPELLKDAQYTRTAVWDSEIAEVVDTVPKAVYLAYFYELGCKKCDRAEYRIKYLESRYSDLEVRSYDVGVAENKRLAEALGMLTDVPEQKRMSTPAVFVGDDFLLGDDVTDKNLISLVEKYGTAGSEPPWERAEAHLGQAEERILNRFRSLEILTIISAGLLDGVNPCAFATLVFFISYLAFVIKKRTDILLVGLAFVAAVFISYFLIGVGLLSFIQRLGFMRVAGRVVYMVTAGIAMIFGILSIHDYFKYSGGDYDKSFLRLPGFLRKRTQDIVRKKMDTEKYVLGAFVTGFLISLLEFACTGQVYLPTIIFVTKIPGLRTKGLLYLLLYNVFFIIPLLAVFLFAYRGMTAERLFFLLRSHGKTVKLLTALMFFGLAGVLIFYLL